MISAKMEVQKYYPDAYHYHDYNEREHLIFNGPWNCKGNSYEEAWQVAWEKIQLSFLEKLNA